MYSTLQIDKVTLFHNYYELSNEKQEVSQLLNEAKDYINFYTWCEEIVEEYVGLIYTGIIGVFLFKIKKSRRDVDEWIWVIVGDVPPSYITVEDCPNPACALDGYIGALEEWVDAAEKGKTVENLIPVNVPANYENAQLLKIRLNFLDNNILSKYKNDLI